MINMDALRRFLMGPPLITVNAGRQERHVQPTPSVAKVYPEVVTHPLDPCFCKGQDTHYHMPFIYWF